MNSTNNSLNRRTHMLRVKKSISETLSLTKKRGEEGTKQDLKVGKTIDKAPSRAALAKIAKEVVIADKKEEQTRSAPSKNMRKFVLPATKWNKR